MLTRIRGPVRSTVALLALLAAGSWFHFNFPRDAQRVPHLILSTGFPNSFASLRATRLIGFQLGIRPIRWSAPTIALANKGLGYLLLLWLAIEAWAYRFAVRGWIADARQWWRRTFPAPVVPSPRTTAAEGRGATSSPGSSASRSEAQRLANALPKVPVVDEGELLERALSRLEVGAFDDAIVLLKQLLAAGSSNQSLVRYYLILAYCQNRQEVQARDEMNSFNAGTIPVSRRYKLALALDGCRLYDQALPLFEQLRTEQAPYPDVIDRLTRLRQIIYEGGAAALDRELFKLVDRSYDNLRVMASGAQGVVMSGFDMKAGRNVALKMMSPFLRGDAEARKRFLREAMVLTELQHPNVVRTFAVHPEPCPHYAMELITAGKTLADLLTTDGQMSRDRLRQLATQILAGLGYCHTRGLVHRDIKPQNILVPDGLPLKIIDFGLVKLAKSTGITVEGAVMGTPAYMPPEQLRGQEIDHTADIYAFGVVLYEMATAHLPFPPNDQMAARIVAGLYDPPSKLRPDLGPTFDFVVGQCMQRDRAARFTRAADVQRALDASLSVMG